jgi:hypothetical protein
MRSAAIRRNFSINVSTERSDIPPAITIEMIA